MHRALLGSTCLLFTVASVACGGDALDGPPPIAEPIRLREVDLTPGCYVDPPTSPSSDLETEIARAERAALEFQLSFAREETELLTAPVRADPVASNWSLREDGRTIEGTIVARGPGWALLKLVATLEAADGDVHTFDLDIDVTLSRTRYEFGGVDLEVHPDYFRFGDFHRGCDPGSGLSFEAWYGPGRPPELGRSARCWPEPSAAEGDRGEHEELEATFQLECRQRIERLLLE